MWAPLWAHIIQEATKHGEAVEHVGVGETVDIEENRKGTKLRQFHRYKCSHLWGERATTISDTADIKTGEPCT
jgi:hypothetical protein